MNAKAALIGALFALAGLGIAEIVWADTAGAYSSATSPGISLRISSRFGDFAIDAAVPLTTPTAIRTPTATFTPSATPTNISSPTARPTSFVDLVGQASWIRCPDPELRMTTRINGASFRIAGPSVMRLENRLGDWMEVQVPSLGGSNPTAYDYDCPIGSCLPSSWLPALPYTLTVDYYDQVFECCENNNTSILSAPPPPCPITPSVTPTWTETATATATASSTVTASYTHTPSATPSNTASPAGQATLTPTPTATTCSAGFSDVSSSDYFYEAVGWLYCHGAISGYGDGTFRPYNLLTRGQMCKITVLGFGLTVWSPPTCNFVDCSSAYQPYIETLYHAEVVSGYDCGAGCLEFRPNANVTRGQVAKIVTLTGITFRGWPILDPIGATFRDVPAGSPFYSYVETAYCHGLISGYSCGGQAEPCPGLYFRPNGSTTRGQVSKIVYGGTLSGPACGSRGGRR